MPSFSSSSSVSEGSVPFSNSSINLRISSARIVLVSPSDSSSCFLAAFLRFFSSSFFSMIFAFSRWVTSQFARISSIFIWPVTWGSSCFCCCAATSTPLATATPAFRTSAKLEPEIVVTISEVFSILVLGLGGTGRSSGRLSRSGDTISAIGSGRSGRSMLPVTCTFSRIFWAILGSGAGRSFGFLNIGFFFTGSFFSPAKRLSYFSCCKGVSGLYFIFSSIAW